MLLGGQAVAPQSFAKVYWNKETQVVYVDAVFTRTTKGMGVSSLGFKTKSFDTYKYWFIG
jgi:hypothetical protein